MLYVDAGNESAVRLYASLGFRTVHAEQAFVGRHGTAPRPASAANASDRNRSTITN
jgi:hypothetical protein